MRTTKLGVAGKDRRVVGCVVEQVKAGRGGRGRGGNWAGVTFDRRDICTETVYLFVYLI